MKQIKFSLLLSTLLTISLFAQADMKLVDEYVKLSGINKIVKTLPKSIKKGYLTHVQNDRLKDINISRNFDFEPTINYIKLKLSDELSNSIIKQSINFYKTPLGKKFKDNGLSTIDKSINEKEKEFYENLEKYPPSYERLNIVNNFIDRIELSPIAVHMIGELLGSINAKLVTSKKPDEVMQNMAGEIKEYIYQNSLYAYGDFSQQELQDIIKYSNTNAGRFEQMVVSRIFKQIIGDSFTQIMIDSREKLALKL
jgi:hypothetical protein